MPDRIDPRAGGLPGTYPSTERLDLIELLHGHRIADPYRWLEDSADPRTVQWSEQQDELFAAFRRTWAADEDLEFFRTRTMQLADTGFVGPPVWRGERRFHLRRQAGQEHNILVTADADGIERPLIDPAEIDPSGRTVLDDWHPSPDGALLAYLTSEGGTEESVLRVIEVDGGRLVDGPIDRVKYTSMAWLPDGTSFFYVRRLAADGVPEGESEYHRRVYLHRLGVDCTEDLLVFGDDREKTSYYTLALSADGRWLAVTSQRGTDPRTEVHLADLAAADGPVFTVVQEGADAETYPRFGRDGRLYLFTTLEAPNGRLCVVDPEAVSRGPWQEVLAEDTQAVLRDYALLDGPEAGPAMVLALRSRLAISELMLHDGRDGSLLAPIPTPGAGAIDDAYDAMVAAHLFTHPDGGPYAWLNYTDDTTPLQVYRFDVRSRELTLWAEAACAVELGSVHVKRFTYQSKDGTGIQLTVMSPTGEPDRPRPTILYGYGGYGVSLGPQFNPGRIPWVEAGGVFAIANLRGGGERGEAWHRAGMLGTKQNTFDDFHAAGDWLVVQGWTTREQLGVIGQSNGGLLVGAALTQRPEAYAAAVCSEPLLDMLRYERSGLGATWSGEFGSASVSQEFEWLLGYSPYHRVHDVDQGTPYPAVLFTVFEGDTRVDPLHARKLTAALQHATSVSATDRPILLRREFGVGHADRSMSSLFELAMDQLGFLKQQLGMGRPPATR